MEEITKEDLDILESVISDAQSYYNQPAYYDHCSLEGLKEAEGKAHRAMYIIDLLRDKLGESK